MEEEIMRAKDPTDISIMTIFEKTMIYSGFSYFMYRLSRRWWLGKSANKRRFHRELDAFMDNIFFILKAGFEKSHKYRIDMLGNLADIKPEKNGGSEAENMLNDIFSVSTGGEAYDQSATNEEMLEIELKEYVEKARRICDYYKEMIKNTGSDKASFQYSKHRSIIKNKYTHEQD